MKNIQFLMNIHYIFANIHSKEQKSRPAATSKREIFKKKRPLTASIKLNLRQPRVISLNSYYLTSIVYLAFFRLLPSR